MFIAMFKIDKKLISSDTCYILINLEKKIAGLSGSCISMMNLDLTKRWKLA